ncbi:MAG TPA: DinB family protein, partial [Myxococcaceae bacterium]|nr:DinB family protein [Myxococcaceae bacterium]
MIEDAETKLTKLAQAIPSDKYSWRPGKDVRSVSEVFMHVAAGNFAIPRRIGSDPPAGFTPQGFDKSTADKSKVMDEMKRSFAHAKQAVAKLTDADMEKTADWIGGRKATYREIIFFLATHDHEHLGQS